MSTTSPFPTNTGLPTGTTGMISEYTAALGLTPGIQVHGCP